LERLLLCMVHWFFLLEDGQMNGINNLLNQQIWNNEDVKRPCNYNNC
jgi:hypothetical protein